MCGCYFDLKGKCDLFSTSESLRPCMFDNKKECDFYVTENDIKLYAIQQTIIKVVKNIAKSNNKDGD